jgi:hypothetical protein
MKNILWLVGEFCAAATGFLAWNCKRNAPVELLAPPLGRAWEDHRFVVKTN